MNPQNPVLSAQDAIARRFGSMLQLSSSDEVNIRGVEAGHNACAPGNVYRPTETSRGSGLIEA